MATRKFTKSSCQSYLPLRPKHRIESGIIAIALASGSVGITRAAPIIWVGGNANWDAADEKWNPQDEPDSNDEAVFNTPDTVNYAITSSADLDAIQGLTLSGGANLNTSGNNIIVKGLVQLAGTGTRLIVGGAASQISAYNISINSGGTIQLDGGTIVQNMVAGEGLFAIDTGGNLTGNGTINLTDAVASGTDLFFSTLMVLSGGTLTATSSPSASDPYGVAAATLTINITDPDARLDLDGYVDFPVINVSRNDTLAINGRTHDADEPYSGTLNLSEGSTLSMSVPWQTDTCMINASTAGITPGSAGAPATISGATFTFDGGSINLGNTDSLRFSAPFTASSGTINNAGLIIFNANSTIGAGANFHMTGTSASLTVNAGITVNIGDPDFNAGGGGTATNVVTINSDGTLNLHLGTGAADALSGTTALNGGVLAVTTLDHTWKIDGNVNIGASSGTSSINGDEVTFTGSTVSVGGNSALDINAPSIWGATGNLAVGAGAVARINGTTRFNQAGNITGSGSLRIAGAATVSTATVFNMPSGTVELDGADTTGNSIVLFDNLTINAGAMPGFGNVNAAGTDTLQLHQFANLTVNLTDPSGEWTLDSTGVLDIDATVALPGGSGIQGSDFRLAGTADISGNSIWNARTDISGTVIVALNGSLNLRGGTLANTNRLEGGSITGAGSLRASTGDALVGFGTIGTSIEFADNSEVRADDGILNVTGPIADAGVIGTADDDGILNVTNAWNTNAVGNVNLQGGELRGATVTTGAGGVTGDGLVSARVINSGSISAENNATLVVATAANNNNWDGSGSGLLQATSGNLEIRDNAGFAFTGGVFADTGREVYANGFELEFDPGSTLSLRGGTFHSTQSTDFGGAATVIAGGQSILQIDGTAIFENGSSTTLNDNVRLNTPLTVIQPGAGFSGSGSLINPATRTLRLTDGVVAGDFNAIVRNEGQLQLGAPSTGAQVQARNFLQTASGTLQIELGGIATSAYDRLNLTGSATLSGVLDISLIGGFVPTPGQTFSVLTATGGIAGTFSSVIQPPAMPAGLSLAVTYNATSVQLKVIGTLPFDVWIDSFASITNSADRLKGADPDRDGMNNLGEFALDGNPASGSIAAKIVAKIAPVTGINALTLSLPVRTGSTADPADPAGGELGLRQTADGISYKVQASNELTNWTLDVTEVTGTDATTIQTGLPALDSGWSYRTFRSPGPVAGVPRKYMRVVIGE